MKLTEHIAEPDLILYQLQDPDQTATAAEAVRTHLEVCPACAELADSIAQTLRVFSAAPVPPPDLDRAWHTLRPRLTPLVPASPSLASRPFRPAPFLGLAVAALLLLAVFFSSHPAPRPAASPLTAGRPGPLTDHPVDSALAAHLDGAERFLTTVSHTSAPLDPATRAEAQTLLIHNALYVQRARQQGDLVDAALLEKLGRVLTSADHEPAADSTSGWHVRLELSTNGLLLDLRILRQNEAAALPHRSQTTQDAAQ